MKTTRMLRVYTGAKIEDWEYLQRVFAKLPYAYAHARWLKHIELGTTESPENAQIFWQEDLEDIQSADIVVIYGGHNDKPLRGALVEAGAAIAFGKTVIACGDHSSFGTWQYHPLVLRMRSMAHVLDALEELATGA
jgi:nucleoside 2-deoxyribosyltransferase